MKIEYNIFIQNIAKWIEGDILTQKKKKCQMK
jgi:hypothetical protein